MSASEALASCSRSRFPAASYPDLVELDGTYFLSATNKEEARLIPIDPALLEGMWSQKTSRMIATAGLTLDADRPDVARGTLTMPRLTNFRENAGGFAFDLWFELARPDAGQVLLDSRASGRSAGVVITTTAHGSLRLELNDGKNSTAWECDPGLIRPRQRHHVVFNVDAAPRLITVIVDGQLCDGGDTEGRSFGYTRFGDSEAPLTGKELGDVSGSDHVTVSPSVQHLRIYDRYLTTSESVGNYHASSL